MTTIEQLREQLEQLSIHQKYPYFTPFIGDHYLENEVHKKLLIVGESHYLPGNSKIEIVDTGRSKNNRLNWYRNPPSVDFLKQENSYDWLNTRMLGLRGNNTPFMLNIKQALAEVLEQKNDSEHSDIFKHVAYCNFFVRPSKQEKDGNAIHPISAIKEDKLIANERMLEIIKTISPDLIMLLGVETYKGTWEAGKNADGKKLTLSDIAKASGLDVKYFYTYHPSYTSLQWNAVQFPDDEPDYFGGLTSHQFFNQMLEKYWLK